MLVKRLSAGNVAYYWSPHKRDKEAGFTLDREALGPDYGIAVERATILNAHLDAWRQGRNVERVTDAQPGYGTLGWLLDMYRRSDQFQNKVGERAKPGYERALRAIEDMPTRTGGTAAQLPLKSITPRAVDRIYERLQQGSRKANRTRQANYAIDIMRRAWKIVQRKYPTIVPTGNPWVGVERVGKKATKPAATRQEAYALANALKVIGEPHLGAAALICFEWHQRPENVLAGNISWHDYRHVDDPHVVNIRHHKTGVAVPLDWRQPRRSQRRKHSW
jgi:hypothetical protein